MSVTMKQIAEHMGVSRQLVSYALNGNGTISQARKREILQVATELGYQPNSLARAVATGRNRVLGFIGHHEANAAEFQWRLLRGASEEAKLHGYLIKILLTTDPEMAAQYCIESRLAGLLTVTVDDPAFVRLHDALKAQKRQNIPLALMENEGPLPGGICVYSNYKTGLKMVLQHLRQLGHQRIGYIAGSATEHNGIARAQMFREAAAELEIPLSEKSVVAGQWWDARLSYEATRHLLNDAAQRPTAIVCAGDPIALAAIDAARSLGLRVPDDVSITGFADFQMAQFSSPSLTTVAQPFEEVGAVATRHLLLRIETPQDKQPDVWPEQKELLEPRLVVRKSTAPPQYDR